MSLRNLSYAFNRVISRSIHTTIPTLGEDLTEKRKGAVKKSDAVEGENLSSDPVSTSMKSSYELIDENLMNTVINNVKFKDIPIIHIICTRNNTKMVLTTGRGHVLALKTAGIEGFKNCRKGTTVAAQAVANRILSYARDHDLQMARLVFDGLGPGRSAAFQVIEASGFNIVSLSDRTRAVEPWTMRPRAAKRL